MQALPNTTFAQNNGVIVLSRCASRSAGVACGVWLILFGVLAKIGGWVSPSGLLTILPLQDSLLSYLSSKFALYSIACIKSPHLTKLQQIQKTVCWDKS